MFSLPCATLLLMFFFLLTLSENGHKEDRTKNFSFVENLVCSRARSFDTN